MKAQIEQFEREMAAAAEAQDFEQARCLRDRINLMRGGASADDAERADTSGLARQQPGAMGIGTSRGQPVTPPGWKPPRKPDLRTTGRTRKD